MPIRVLPCSVASGSLAAPAITLNFIYYKTGETDLEHDQESIKFKSKSNGCMQGQESREQTIFEIVTRYVNNMQI